MTVTVPVKTVNPLNGSHGKWQIDAARRKKQRVATWAVLRREWSRPPLPMTITLTRIAPSNGLDDDSLPASMKSIRDEIADWLGLLNDREPCVTWNYSQRRGRPREYAVVIDFKPRPA